MFHWAIRISLKTNENIESPNKEIESLSKKNSRYKEDTITEIKTQ